MPHKGLYVGIVLFTVFFVFSVSSAPAQIGGRTSADGPFLLDDVEDLNLVAAGVMRNWLGDYIHPSGDVLSVLPLSNSGLTLAPGQSPVGALLATIPAQLGYISGGFGVPMPSQLGESTLTHPGDISSFETLTFLACYEPTGLPDARFQVVLETYPGPDYPKIYWNYTPSAGKTFQQVAITLREPSQVENANGLSVEQLLAQTRLLYFYHLAGPVGFQVQSMRMRMDDIRLEGVAAIPTPVPDIDHDGLPDGVEAGNLALTADQSNRLLPDCDLDGLLDSEEDANLSGGPDPGETHTRRADSDNDGYEDGLEVLFMGSDPLDAGDPGTPMVDADGDRLPAALDPDDNNRDTDGDRYDDLYDALVFRDLAAASDASRVPNLGDVNGDAEAGNLDSLVIQALFLNTIDHTNPVFQQGGADYDGYRYADPSRDGQAGNLDSLLIQAHFLGNLRTFPLRY